MSLDQRLGVLYGQAIGDSLGYLTESLTLKEINQRWPDPNWPSSHPKHPPTKDWCPGDWTDDTDQAIGILQAYIGSRALGSTDIQTDLVAKEFHHWMVTNGRGIGIMTQRVMSDPDYLRSPIDVAIKHWQRSRQQSAPNGAVMRTSYVGILHPDDIAWTERNALACCSVTHADPRCQASVVAVTNCIAYLIQGYDIPEATSKARRDAMKYDHGIQDWMSGSWDFVDPSNQREMGYTYRCVGTAFWALRYVYAGDGFLNPIRTIVRAGGDADTNAAVAGALIGAAIGASNIPEHLIKGLVYKATLDQLWQDTQCCG